MATVYQFWAHVGGFQEPFLGTPEDCGYRQGDDGRWRDVRGNTGELRERPLDPKADLDLLVAAYAGEGGTVEDWDHFRGWATGEGGLTAEECEAAVREAVDEAESFLSNPDKN